MFSAYAPRRQPKIVSIDSNLSGWLPGVTTENLLLAGSIVLTESEERCGDVGGGLSLPTIQRLEKYDGVPSGHMKTITAIFRVLQEQGIELIGTPDDAPGVRLHSKSKT